MFLEDKLTVHLIKGSWDCNAQREEMRKHFLSSLNSQSESSVSLIQHAESATWRNQNKKLQVTLVQHTRPDAADGQRPDSKVTKSL